MSSIARPRRSGLGRRIVVASAILLVVVPALLAVTSAGARDAIKPIRGGTLTVGVPQQFVGFDPYALIGRNDYQALLQICDTLFTYGSNYAPQGMLAQTWSNVGTALVLHLRRGIKFTDGTPLNASAVKFSLLQVKRGPFGSQISMVRSIAVVDAYTLRLVLTKPSPTLPALLTQQQTSIVSPAAYRKLGSKGFSKHPVCSGPFKFVSWDPSTQLVLARNPSYWRQDANGQPYPYLDKLVFKILPDPQASVAALQAGDADLIVNVPPALISTVGTGSNTTIARRAGLGWQYFFLQTQAAPLNNVHLRRAIELTIDRASIVGSIAFGAGAPALGPINTTSWAYDPQITKNGFYKATADLTKAKQELAAGGSPNGFTFTLEYPTEDPWTGMAQAVKAQLAKIGIKVDLVGKDIGSVLDDLFASKFSGGLMIDFSGRIDPDLGMAAFYQTNGANNFEKYSNAQVDSLLNQARSTSDLKKRASLYRQVQKIVNQDAPVVLVYFPDDVKGLSKKIHGYQDLGDERPAFFDVWLSR